MYPYTSPAALHREYETRVADAGRKHQLALEARSRRAAARVSSPRNGARMTFRAWLATLRDRLERHLQPAEEGYIA